jgi:putative ABC transport system permease protein
MNPVITQLLYTLETALLFSVVTIGVFVAFRVLRFPDLTSEGGFGFSAIIAGIVLIKTGSSWLGLISGLVAGVFTGTVTAFLANKVRLPTILASILTMTMCFSGGLLIAGKPSETLPEGWVLNDILAFLGSPIVVGIVGLAVVFTLVILGLHVFFQTGSGYILRVRGENPSLCGELGHSLLIWDLVGLGLSNGLVGLTAALLSQRAGYASINMGRGVAISAIAAIMLSEALFPTRRLRWSLLACFGGTLILQLVRLMALNFGIPDGGLDLVTSLMVIGFCWFASRREVGRPSLLDQIRM